MFYKVVMQGRTLGGADVVAVTREFLRVTGLPASFAEHLFEGMPRVIKRQVSQPDAERIAATLRAIGAAATVEREFGSAADDTPEGIRIVAAPLSGPPTVIPGAAPAPQAPPSRPARALRAVGEKLPLIGGSLLAMGVAVLAAPHVEGLVAALHPPMSASPVAAPKPAAPDAAAMAATTPLNSTLLHGPWRCVDQRSGTPHYWTYDPDGLLVDHGDVFKEGADPRAAATPAPMTWKVEGRRLLHTAPPQAADAYTVTDLTLMHLRYSDDKGLDIQCRRP
ncbi:MAG: hypothetical protein IT518_26885 [Burkholderiales bacterium]|nr:hypothetical protein [Burkholderiales bacterium]